MKKTIALASTLAALLAAPLAASADTQAQLASLPAGQYLIVDARSGQTIGKLVALDGNERGLRTLGTVTAAAPEAAKAPLFPHIPTIGPSADDLRAEFHQQFGIVDGS